MAEPAEVQLWVALTQATIESRPKEVVEDPNFRIKTSLTRGQAFDLVRIRSLVSTGGDVSAFYRQSAASDRLLKKHRVLHLHLGGAGSDALLYLIQYPQHVLLLMVDTHIHLDDSPPGKKFNFVPRNRFERGLQAEAATRVEQARADVLLARLQHRLNLKKGPPEG